MKQFRQIPFGKHKGHTIPWLVFNDIEYFKTIQALPSTDLQELGDDLIFVAAMTNRIRVPENRTIHIAMDANNRFQSIELDHKFFIYDDGYERYPVIDLPSILNIRIRSSYDYRKIVNQLKFILFGSKHIRMTEDRCQQFFRNPENFGIKLVTTTSESETEVTLAQGEELHIPAAIPTPNPSPEAPESPSTHSKTISKIKSGNAVKILSINDSGLLLSIPIPKALLDRIDSVFPNKTQRKRIKDVIYYILQRHQLQSAPIVKYLGYSREVKEDLLTTRFYKCWQQLVDVGILELYKDEDGITFHWKRGITKRYRIHYKLLVPPFDIVEITYNHRHYIIGDEQIVKYVGHVVSQVTVERPSSDLFDEALRKISYKLKLNSGLLYVSEKSIIKINRDLAPNSQVVHDSNTRNMREFDMINHTYGMTNTLKSLDYKLVRSSRCELNGRVNHNLTDIDKLLFPFLRLKGESIVEIDISNSQPLIFAHTLKKIILEHTESRIIYEEPLYDRILYNYILNQTSPPHTPTPTLLCSHFDQTKLEELIEEVNEMLSWCSAGQFYEKMVNYYASLHEAVTRDEMKEAYTKVLFGKYSHPGTHKTMVAGKFPIIVGLLDGFKKTMYEFFRDNILPEYQLPEEFEKYLHSKSQGSKTPFEAGNDYLAIRLQEIEASIVIDRVLTSIAAAGLTAFSRHDSICCPESQFEDILRVVRYEMDLVFGADGYHLKDSRWK